MEETGLVGSRRPALDGGNYDTPLVRKNVVENAVVANTPAPAGRLQAFDVAAEWITFELVEGLLDAYLVPVRKFSECFSGGLGDEQCPIHGGVDSG